MSVPGWPTVRARSTAATEFVRGATKNKHMFLASSPLVVLPSTRCAAEAGCRATSPHTHTERLGWANAFRWSCVFPINATDSEFRKISVSLIRGRLGSLRCGGEGKRELTGRVQGQSTSAQLRVCRFFSRSGLRRVGLCPPAAATSACTAASQANVSRAAGT